MKDGWKLTVSNLVSFSIIVTAESYSMLCVFGSQRVSDTSARGTILLTKRSPESKLESDEDRRHVRSQRALNSLDGRHREQVRLMM